jgi:hypothetical protein
MFNINKIFNKNKEKPSNINSSASKVLAGVIAVGGVASSQSALGVNKDKVPTNKTISYEQNKFNKEENYIMSSEDLRTINELSQEAKLDLIKDVLNNQNSVYVKGDYVYVSGGIEIVKDNFSKIPVCAYNLKPSTYYIDNSIGIPWSVDNSQEVSDFIEKDGIDAVGSEYSPGGKIKVRNEIVETGIIGPSYVYNRIRESGKSIEEAILLISQKDEGLVGEVINGLKASISSGGIFENDELKISEIKKEIEQIESINLNEVQGSEQLANK